MATSKRYSRKGKRKVSRGRKSRKGQKRFTRKTILGGGGIELWKIDNDTINKIEKEALTELNDLNKVIVFQGDKPVYQILVNDLDTDTDTTLEEEKNLSFEKYLENYTSITLKRFRELKPRDNLSRPNEAADNAAIGYDRYNTENMVQVKEFEKETNKLNIRWISLEQTEIDDIVELKNKSKNGLSKALSKAFSFVKKTISSNKINVMNDLRYARDFIYLNSISDKQLQQENFQKKYITENRFYSISSDVNDFTYATVEDQNREMTRYGETEIVIGPKFDLEFNCLKIEVKESTEADTFLRYVRQQKNPQDEPVGFPLKPEVFKTRVLNHYKSLI